MYTALLTFLNRRPRRVLFYALAGTMLLAFASAVTVVFRNAWHRIAVLNHVVAEARYQNGEAEFGVLVCRDSRLIRRVFGTRNADSWTDRAAESGYRGVGVTAPTWLNDWGGPGRALAFGFGSVSQLMLRGMTEQQCRAIAQIDDVSELKISRGGMYCTEFLERVPKWNLRSLELEDSRISPDQLKVLLSGHRLEYLALTTHSSIDVTALTNLTHHRRLKELVLNGVRGSPQQWKSLIRELPKLHKLVIDSVEVDDDVLLAIRESLNLTTLGLKRSHISSSGIEQIARMSRLKSLMLKDMSLSAKDLAGLERCGKLLSVACFRVKVDQNDPVLAGLKGKCEVYFFD